MTTGIIRGTFECVPLHLFRYGNKKVKQYASLLQWLPWRNGILLNFEWPNGYQSTDDDIISPKMPRHKVIETDCQSCPTCRESEMWTAQSHSVRSDCLPLKQA